MWKQHLAMCWFLKKRLSRFVEMNTLQAWWSQRIYIKNKTTYSATSKILSKTLSSHYCKCFEITSNCSGCKLYSKWAGFGRVWQLRGKLRNYCWVRTHSTQLLWCIAGTVLFYPWRLYCVLLLWMKSKWFRNVFPFLVTLVDFTNLTLGRENVTPGKKVDV